MAAPPDLIDLTYFNALFPGQNQTKAGKLISIVSDEVRRYCQREFYTKTYTEYFSGNGNKTIQLSYTPIIQNSIAIYDDGLRVWPSSSLVPGGYYFVNLDTGLVEINSNFNFYRGNRNIKVVYDAGFGTTMDELPEALKGAAAFWVALSLNAQANPDTFGQKTIRQGDITIVMDLEDPPTTVRKKLNRFREPVI